MPDTGAEFALWMTVEKLGRDPMTFKFDATKAQCVELVSKLDIAGVASCSASGELSRKDGGSQIILKAMFKAEVDQDCVLTLKPVTQKIEEEFVMCYTFSKADTVLEDGEHVIGSNEDDLPELIVEGKINVVQAVVEQIALALDPYPRAEDAGTSDSADILQQSAATEATKDADVHNPFAGLKDLMNKD
jgi:uncharacterized metal-binding protein YceD (DUF177 family)